MSIVLAEAFESRAMVLEVPRVEVLGNFVQELGVEIDGS